MRVLHDNLGFDRGRARQVDGEFLRARETRFRILRRWLIGDLSKPSIEDLADEILSRGVAKGWIAGCDGPGFDDYYRVTRDGREEAPDDEVVKRAARVARVASGEG